MDGVPPTIKAIPTTRNGVQFRSKLEADFGDYLDGRGVVWAHEAEGFDLSGVWYLPDFWLPEQRQFVEVKGVLDEDSDTKVKLLAEAGVLHDFEVVLAEPPRWKLSLIVDGAYQPAEWKVDRFTVSPVTATSAQQHMVDVFTVTPTPAISESAAAILRGVNRGKKKGTGETVWQQLKVEGQKQAEKTPPLPVKEVNLCIGGDQHGEVVEKRPFQAKTYVCRKELGSGVLVVNALVDPKLHSELSPLVAWLLGHEFNGAEEVKGHIEHLITKEFRHAATLKVFADEALKVLEQELQMIRYQKTWSEEQAAAATKAAVDKLDADLAEFLGG